MHIFNCIYSERETPNYVSWSTNINMQNINMQMDGDGAYSGSAV